MWGQSKDQFLNAIFISPLLYLTDITIVADDNYALVLNTCKDALKVSMQLINNTISLDVNEYLNFIENNKRLKVAEQ